MSFLSPSAVLESLPFSSDGLASPFVLGGEYLGNAGTYGAIHSRIQQVSSLFSGYFRSDEKKTETPSLVSRVTLGFVRPTKEVDLPNWPDAVEIPLAEKLSLISEKALELIFPEISDDEIQDEAMYYERLANGFRLCVGDEVADAKDLLLEGITHRFRTEFAESLERFLREDSQQSSKLRESLNKNTHALRQSALDLLQYASSLQGHPAQERAGKIAQALRDHSLELAGELGPQDEDPDLNTIGQSIIIALGEMSYNTNINYLPAFAALIHPTTRALDLDAFVQEDPDTYTSYLVMLSTLQSLTTIPLFDSLLRPRFLPEDGAGPGLDAEKIREHTESVHQRLLESNVPPHEQSRKEHQLTLLASEDFSEDSQALLRDFLARQFRNEVSLIRTLLEDFTEHKQKYAPFLGPEGLGFEAGARLELDILEATLIAAKDHVAPFLEKILSLNLVRFFYGPHDNPELAFGFTKWMGSIETVTGIAIDIDT